jgi:hypothetical protein
MNAKCKVHSWTSDNANGKNNLGDITLRRDANFKTQYW